MESQMLSAISHIKIISKKRPINERILTYLNKKRATKVDEKTVKEVLCSLRAKNLLKSNDTAESEENGIPNLPNFIIYMQKLSIVKTKLKIRLKIC